MNMNMPYHVAGPSRVHTANEELGAKREKRRKEPAGGGGAGVNGGAGAGGRGKEVPGDFRREEYVFIYLSSVLSTGSPRVILSTSTALKPTS